MRVEYFPDILEQIIKIKRQALSQNKRINAIYLNKSEMKEFVSALRTARSSNLAHPIELGQDHKPCKFDGIEIFPEDPDREEE